jgi:hypothetical protein
MSAPDVLYLRGDQFYTDIDRAWDARNVQPLVEMPAVKPLTHRAGCQVAPWPDLAAVCPCTANQRYAHRRRAEVAA